MNATYLKRFKMQIDLRDAPPAPSLPKGYFWEPWNDLLLEAHAEVNFQSFQGEIDAAIFPRLSDRDGCLGLMREISGKLGFLPAATWLVGYADSYCGTVQGVRNSYGLGVLQNLGVLAAHRGQGLGSALLLKALEGFRLAGLSCAFLEVTSHNEAAIQLYRRLGFRCRKTIYKEIETDKAAGRPLAHQFQHAPEAGVFPVGKIRPHA